MTKKILIIGSTGKLGKLLLNYCNKNDIPIEAIASYKNHKLQTFQQSKMNIKHGFCLSKDDEFLKFSLCGLASFMIFQTFIHIGVNTNLLPTTGMTLPFLSYGGSSLIGSAVLAGIILNYTKIKLDIDEQ